MKIGDIIRCRQVTSQVFLGAFGADTYTKETFRPTRKGDVLVLAVLGSEPANATTPFDLVAAMKGLGWVPGPELAAHIESLKQGSD